jgi:hypothetical protein
VYLLPYMERLDVYSQIDPGFLSSNSQYGAWAYSGPLANQDTTNYTFSPNANLGSGGGADGEAVPLWATFTVKTYLCPADPTGLAGAASVANCADMFFTIPSTGPGVPAFVDGDDFPSSTNPSSARSLNNKVGFANYLSCAGFIGPDPNGWAAAVSGLPAVDFRGIYCVASTTKLVDIKDGTSNTIAFGEYCTPPPSYTGQWGVYGMNTDGSGPNTLGYAWAGAGGMVTGFGLPNPANQGNYFQFSSGHGNVFTFAFGDGSVRMISATADPVTFQYVGGMADGQDIAWSKLGL